MQNQADTYRYVEEVEPNDQNPGTIYRIPPINRQLETNFQTGDKVKIYWRGIFMESLPGQIDGTVLMIKIGN